MDADGDVVGDVVDEAVGLETGPPVIGDGRLSGLFTKSTPTINTAMTQAAMAAIQYGPRASGAWVIAKRTRSRSPGLGWPVTWSKTWFSSWRKFSLLTSEHLLHSEVAAQALCGPINS
jgi:hypothetical protein